MSGIEFNKEKARKAESLGIKVFSSDLNRTFPLGEDYFDIIFSHFVIEHIFDVDNFVREIRRVLRLGGCAIIGKDARCWLSAISWAAG